MLSTQRVAVIALSSFFVLFLFFHTYPENGSSLRKIKDLPKAHSHSRPNTHNALRALFDAIRHPYTENYTDPLGNTFILEGKPSWTKPLGKKLLIVDIDTRVPNKTDEILSPGPIDWENNEFSRKSALVSNGIMDHYMYAQIHGYEYRYFQAQHIEGLYDTWIRPHALRKLLPDYQFVLTMDADVTITHPEVPMEWLFNKWGVKPNTSISMPWDQKEIRHNHTQSVDSKGEQVLNGGFVLVQNLPHTMDLLEAWRDCPTEKRYKGCAHWKEIWSHEQRAFSEYVRYDFNPDGDNIVPIPCDDAMGWPGMMDEFKGRIVVDCKGNFFRHHTLNKSKPKQSVAVSIMQLIAQSVQRSFQDDQDNLWVVEKKDEERARELSDGLSQLIE